MPRGALGLLVVNVAPVDTQRGARGPVEVALKVKKGPGWSGSYLAGLVAVGPFVGEQLRGLCRVPACKGSTGESALNWSPASCAGPPGTEGTDRPPPPPPQGGRPPHSPPSEDSQLLRLGERVRSSAPGPW